MYFLYRSFFGKKDDKSPSTLKSKKCTPKKQTVPTTPERRCGNDDTTRGSPERREKETVVDGADSPVFKRRLKKFKRVIIDSDDGEDGEGEGVEGEGGEGETVVKGEGEKMEDSEGGEQMMESNRENEERVEQEGRMDNGKREEEMEIENEGKFCL